MKGKNHDKKAVFLGNLDFKTQEEDIRKLFSKCWEGENVRLVRDATTLMKRRLKMRAEKLLPMKPVRVEVLSHNLNLAQPSCQRTGRGMPSLTPNRWGFTTGSASCSSTGGSGSVIVALSSLSFIGSSLSLSLMELLLS